MHRAESAERGYLLTDQSIYLDDYRQLSATIAPMLAKLKQAEQQQDIAQAASLVEQRLAEMNMNIELHIGGEALAAQDRVRVGMGRSEMESLGLWVERMLAEERRLLEIRQRALQRANLLLLVIGVLSAFLLRLIAP
jgi:CHASE3 domain sensor protein